MTDEIIEKGQYPRTVEAVPTHVEHVVHNAHETEVEGGEVLAQVDTFRAGATGLKLGKDNHTVLLPQPSDDPHDPLNWSWTKKHLLLASVCLGAFQCDFTGTVSPAVIIQAREWNMTPNSVNQATSINVLMLGIGGIVWIPVSQFWGRAPVLFYTAAMGFAFCIGCSTAQTFPQFYAFRALASLFQSSYLSIGLNIIQEVFFFHERTRKIGIWVFCVLSSATLGPVFGNFMLYFLGDWRATMWLATAVAGLNFVLMPILADETHYDRGIVFEQQPKRGSKLWRLLGVWQIKHHNYFLPIFTALQRVARVWFKPLVFMGFFYFFLAYMWYIGTAVSAPILLQSPRESGGYGFTTLSVGYLQFAPLLGITLGEVFGHFFNDYIADRYTRRHDGLFTPEARLPSNVIATVLMVPGLVLLGISLHHHLHWAGIAFGWGLYNCGACITSVAIYAYLADSYPSAAGECSAALNLARCLGGFCVGYFELPWGLRDGYAVSFGAKAAIVGGSLVIIAIFKFAGMKIRLWGGAI